MKKTTLALLLLTCLWACNPAADSAETAKKYLLDAAAWGIVEVYVNDALSYNDGKQVDNFGGVAFKRYMKSVQFREDGAFVGKYEEGEEPKVLHWEVDEKKDIILVTAAKGSQADRADEHRTGWEIAPRNVREDYFEMTTETAAFDYPRVTRIRLVFEKKEGG